jgi:uncharacterized protein (TIGR03435 family)
VIRLVGLRYLMFAAVALAQQPAPTKNHYDTVSIKPGVRAARYGYHYSPGEIRLDNISVPELISGSLMVRGDRLVGLPAWTASERFSLHAKSAAGSNPREQWAMWLPVLEERFGLKYHHEKRRIPVYELSVGSSGIHVPVTVPGSCTPLDPKGVPTAAVDGKKPHEPQPPHNCGLVLAKQLPNSGVELSIRGASMALFCGVLQHYLDRPVVDRTGTNQLFDVQLTFEKTLNAAAVDTASELPTIDSALKRAGFRLARAESDVDVIVIDRLERPAEN